MVYCGAPSKGCLACRKRKIRVSTYLMSRPNRTILTWRTQCDQKQDGCGNCAKIQRLCPGYRNQTDLMFRDQSTHVKKKAEAKAGLNSKRPVSARTTPTVATSEMGDKGLVEPPSSPCNEQHSSLALIHTLAPTIDERTTGWFFLEYTLGGSSAQDLGESLFSSMRAVGLAGFACTHHSLELLIEARKLYVTAIQYTNTALMRPVEAKKDSTLLGILLLSVFETITGCGQRSLTAWADHVQGAAALLKLRGPEQLATQLGLRLFMQVTTELLTTCLQHDTPVPSHILELMEEASKYVDRENLTWRFCESLLTFTEFRYRAKHVTFSDPRVVFEKALDLDEHVVSLFLGLSPLWGYERTYIDIKSEVVFAGFYDVYADFMSVQLWNGMRTMRIMLNRMIQEEIRSDHLCVSGTFSDLEYGIHMKRSNEILNQMCSDILATVPQHLGFCSESSKAGPWSQFLGKRHDFGQVDQTTCSLPLVRVSGGYAILRPLFLVGVLEISRGSVRQWVIKILGLLYRTMGVHQALVLANTLKSMGQVPRVVD